MNMILKDKNGEYYVECENLIAGQYFKHKGKTFIRLCNWLTFNVFNSEITITQAWLDCHNKYIIAKTENTITSDSISCLSEFAKWDIQPGDGELYLNLWI